MRHRIEEIAETQKVRERLLLLYFVKAIYRRNNESRSFPKIFEHLRVFKFRREVGCARNQTYSSCFTHTDVACNCVRMVGVSDLSTLIRCIAIVTKILGYLKSIFRVLTGVIWGFIFVNRVLLVSVCVKSYKRLKMSEISEEICHLMLFRYRKGYNASQTYWSYRA